MIPILMPFIGVGEINFGDPIKEALKNTKYEHLLKKDGYLGDMYLIENPKISYGVDSNGKIIDITCDEECIYKGRNLIGMTIDEFISHTGEKYYGEVDELDFEEGDTLQYVYEFEDIGLQVWEKGKGGKIVTIIASSLVLVCNEDAPE